MAALFGIAGFKNAGKTTLTERLVRALAGRGYAVSTVKHAHHDFEIDQPGRDSYRHREAGAREVALVSSRRVVIMQELRDEDEPALEAVLERLGACDIVLIEGYKFNPFPKIEVRRQGLGHRELAGEDPHIVAVASDVELSGVPVPVLGLDDIDGIADFIVAHVGLEARR